MQLLLLPLTFIIILGSFFYYFYALTNGVILLILAVVLMFIILKARGGTQWGADNGVAPERHMKPARAWSPPWRGRGWLNKNEQAAGSVASVRSEQPTGRTPFATLAFLLLLLTAAFATLLAHQTTEALRSPWESIPPYFFLLYGAAIFLFIVLRKPKVDVAQFAPQSLAQGERARPPTAVGGASPSGSAISSQGKSITSLRSESATATSLPLLILTTFLTLSISLIIFPLGAGFDPFIHQATEKIIAATGTITPKPLYYIGQYTLVVFLSKILGISVVWIDKLLVPLLASIFIPWSIKNWWDRSGTVLLSGVVARAGTDPASGGRASAEAVSRLAGAVNEAKENRSERSLAQIFFLLIPFLLAPFTVTTPYSIALLFLLALIFYTKRNVSMGVSVPQSLTQAGAGMVSDRGRRSEGRVGVLRRGWSAEITSLWNGSAVITFLLATATILIHPLVGIPAFIFLGFNLLGLIKTKKMLVASGYWLVTSLAIPLAFLLASQLSSQIHITFAPQNFLPWLESLSWSGIYRENRFNAPLDLLYFYGFNIKNIFWFFVLTPLILYIKRWVGIGVFAPKGVTEAEAGTVPPAGGERRPSESGNFLAGEIESVLSDEPTVTTHLKTFLILLTSYILMSGFLSFNFLIGYEQADYAKRVLDIAHLFLLPSFFLGVNWWFSRIPRFAAIILLTLGVTASLFLTYPQKVDSYAVSHAFNTSQADIDAVRWIDADAKGEDYIVLANQAVSAAAIRELGFKKYYQAKSTNYPLQTTNSIFFYPIPTGSPLYKFYLKMVYENASAKTLREAIKLIGAERGYFVLNRYWNDFDRIFAEANMNLQLLHSINNTVFIFSI